MAVRSVVIDAMTIEANPDLLRRVAVHSALADPARLTVVDALAMGDASPSELLALLAMPSNLLAHHLGVLERAGDPYPHPVRGRPPPLLPAPDTGRVEHPRPGRHPGRGARGVRVQPELGPLPACGGGVDATQQGARDLGGYPPGGSNPPGHGQSGPAAPVAAAPTHPSWSRRRPAHRRHGDRGLRPGARRTRDRPEPDALVDRRPAATGDNAVFDHALDDLSVRITRLAPAIHPTEGDRL